MSTTPQLVIPCRSAEFLRWFLAHTKVSVVYASPLVLEPHYPQELQQAAAEVSEHIDLAITSSEVASEVTNSTVRDGDTLLFLGTQLRDKLPTLVEKPEAVLLEMLFSLNQDYRKFKQQGRAAFVTPRLAMLALEAGLVQLPQLSLPR